MNIIYVAHIIHVIRIVSMSPIIILTPVYKKEKIDYRMISNEEIFMAINFYNFIHILRLSYHGLFNCQTFKSNILSDMKIQCKIDPWFQMLDNDFKNFYHLKKEELLELFDFEVDKSNEAHLIVPNEFSDFLSGQYTDNEYFDYDQIVDFLKKSIDFMLVNINRIDWANHKALATDQNVKNILYFMTTKYHLEYDNMEDIFTNSTILSIYLDGENIKIDESNQIESTENVDYDKFELNLNKLFLDLIYIFTDLKLDSSVTKINEINQKLIQDEFRKFCQAFVKFNIKDILGLSKKKKILISVDFNKSHFKLFFKLYLCLDSSITQSCYTLVDEINCDIINILKSEDKNILFRIDNKQWDYIYHSYSNSHCAQALKTNFSQVLGTTLGWYNMDRSSRNEMEKIFGKELFNIKEMTFDKLIEDIRKNKRNYKYNYAEDIYDKVLEIISFRSFNNQKKGVVVGCEVNFLYEKIKICVSYIIFYDKLLKIEDIEDDKKAQALGTQKKIAKKYKALRSDFNENNTKEDEKNATIATTSNCTIGLQQKQKLSQETQVGLTNSKGLGTYIPIVPITQAKSNKTKKEAQQKVSKREQMLETIKAEKAAAEAAKALKAEQNAKQKRKK